MLLKSCTHFNTTSPILNPKWQICRYFFPKYWDTLPPRNLRSQNKNAFAPFWANFVNFEIISVEKIPLCGTSFIIKNNTKKKQNKQTNKQKQKIKSISQIEDKCVRLFQRAFFFNISSYCISIKNTDIGSDIVHKGTFINNDTYN